MESEIDQAKMAYKKFIDDIEEFRQRPLVLDREKIFENILTSKDDIEHQAKDPKQQTNSININDTFGAIEKKYRKLLNDGVGLDKINK